MTPYTQAYTENLIIRMERTRGDLKDVIGELMNFVDVRDMSTARKLAEQLHEMVGLITDDLRG